MDRERYDAQTVGGLVASWADAETAWPLHVTETHSDRDVAKSSTSMNEKCAGTARGPAVNTYLL